MSLNLSNPVPDATTTTKGKASFSSTNFDVTSGAVTIKNGGVGPSNLATGATSAVTSGSDTTASTTYADLAGGAGPAVTVTIGANGIAQVSISADLSNNTANNLAWMSFAISGASTAAAADIFGMFYQAYTGGSRGRYGITFILSGLTPGSTTFTAKYKAANGTVTAFDRKISVIPL